MLLRRIAYLLLAAAPITLYAVNSRAQAPAPLKISITASATPAAGVPITISWEFVNTSNAQITGSIVYYLNNYPLTALPTTNNLTVQKGKPASNTFRFDPVPGVNQISVVLLDSHGAGAPTSTLPKLTDVEVGQQPLPAGQSTPAKAPISIVASGTRSWTIIAPAGNLTNGLTADIRKQLMNDYAPLLLFSSDHTGDEQYAPIDVLPFVEASTLTGEFSVPNFSLSNSILKTNPLQILNASPTPNAQAGTITAAQPALPAKLYVTPSSTVYKGADWPTVIQRASLGLRDHDVGLYGHVTLIDFTTFPTVIADDKPKTAAMPNGDPDTFPQRLAARYGCKLSQVCPAKVVKIEYWQFFGYSHDYQGKGDGLVDLFTDHSGDWCSVQLYVDVGWWSAKRPDKAILAVYHYMHGVQVGFDMGTVFVPTPITTPTRAAGAPGSVYLAEEFHGPNYPAAVEIPVVKDNIPFPLVNKAAEVASAQNNIVQLAAQGIPELVTPSGPHGGAPQPTGNVVSYQHPVVYVEWGGHEFWPTTAWSYAGASKHNGGGQYSYFALSPVDLVVDHQATIHGITNPVIPQDVALVTSFAGYWGASDGGGPPQGPPLHTHWYWDPAIAGQALWDEIETKMSDGSLVTKRTD